MLMPGCSPAQLVDCALWPPFGGSTLFFKPVSTPLGTTKANGGSERSVLAPPPVPRNQRCTYPNHTNTVAVEMMIVPGTSNVLPRYQPVLLRRCFQATKCRGTGAGELGAAITSGCNVCTGLHDCHSTAFIMRHLLSKQGERNGSHLKAPRGDVCPASRSMLRPSTPMLSPSNPARGALFIIAKAQVSHA